MVSYWLAGGGAVGVGVVSCGSENLTKREGEVVHTYAQIAKNI
jgi:hypothetical protein